MAVAGVLVIYSIIIIIEMKPIIKSKKRKNIILYSIFMGASLIINLILSIGIAIPCPLKPIEKFITVILG